MSENSRKYEIGEVYDDGHYNVFFTWKIPNVSSIPHAVDFVVHSPSFSYEGASWIFKMYPYGRRECHTRGHMDLKIERLHSEFEKHDLNIHINWENPYSRGEPKVYELLFVPSSFEGTICDFMQNLKEHPQRSKVAPNNIFSLVFAFSKHEIVSKIETNKAVAGYDDTSKQPGTFLDKKMHHDFQQLFLNQEFCDVIIKVKGEEFRAHKAILAARSPVLASTFRNDMKEKATGILDIEDCHPSFFSDFLHFLYCGSVENLTPENVFSLFTTADKYDVQDLRLQCLEYVKMHLSVDTFCETVILALQHSEKELLELAIDFFQKHFQKIIATVKWQRFLTENPIQGNEIMIKSFVSNKK